MDNNINRTTINKIKQATHFLDEKYQKPLQLATIYIEAQLLAETLQAPNENKILNLLQILSPNIGEENMTLINMLVALQGVTSNENR